MAACGKDESTTSKEGENGDSKINIEDFSYSIENSRIVLSSYNGSDENLIINSVYDVDGQNYETDLTSFQVGNSVVKSIIISEGISELYDSIFNSSNIATLYLPKSLNIIYDNTLAYLSEDHINLYYGGTEDQWNSIFTEYEANSVSESFKEGNYEGTGKALADKLNNYVGHEYDSSKFTMNFECTPEDVK